MKTAIGLYDELATAQRVVEDLVNSGFERDHIGLVANNAEYAAAPAHLNEVEDVTVGQGAGLGAVGGGMLGLLAGLGALFIPGLGPVLVAGPLVGALTGAATGALAGGLAAGLINTGVPEGDAELYAEGIRRGGTLVSVETDDEHIGQAVAILNRHDPIDLDHRSTQWGSEQTSKATASASSTASAKKASASSQPSTISQSGAVIPIVQEELQVGKRAVEQGGVRIHSKVSDIPVEEQINLREERVVVERRPVDRPVSGADISNLHDQTIEVTETSEVPVIAKQARVVEEVVVGKEVSERIETVSDTVRRTDVEVENLGQTQRAGTDFNTFDTDFRTHYQTIYGSRGQTYDRYMPAYRYGYTMANDTRFAGRDWSTIESDLRRDWDTSQGPWEDFKDAARHAWDKVRGVR